MRPVAELRELKRFLTVVDDLHGSAAPNGDQPLVSQIARQLESKLGTSRHPRAGSDRDWGPLLVAQDRIVWPTFPATERVARRPVHDLPAAGMRTPASARLLTPLACCAWRRTAAR